MMKKQHLKKSQRKYFYQRTALSTTAIAVKKSLLPPLELPNISRIIPDTAFIKSSSLQKLFVVNFLCGFLLMAIALQGYQINRQLHIKQQTENQIQQIQNEINRWQQITEKYTGYRDAYVHLAVLEKQLGDVQKANEYLQKALSLDPNFKPALTLQEKLESSEKITRLW